jgi:hypothetical protein
VAQLFFKTYKHYLKYIRDRESPLPPLLLNYEIRNITISRNLQIGGDNFEEFLRTELVKV